MKVPAAAYAAILALAITPFFASNYMLFLISLALCYAIWAMGYNVLLGYTGLLSFGHAAYFGVGAYTVAMLSRKLGITELAVLVPAGVAVAALVGAAIGYLCVRYTAIYFALLTLAFGQFIYALVFKFYQWTGGSDGLSVAMPEVLGVKLLLKTYYFVVLVAFTLTVLTLWRVLNSPFGKALQALRDSPARAEFLGIDVKKCRWLAFIVSATFSGLGGALYAPLMGHVTPDILYWTFSGEVLFATLLGGFRYFAGPAIGAVIFVILRSYVVSLTIYWPAFLGATLVVMTLGFRHGVAYLIERALKKLPWGGPLGIARRAGD